ncbi:MAG TPA: alpha/beta fold hydrolase [Ramlibacter sp.]|nr:alpha/beta fold hydrolase [Ramlibacter sp.]
MPARSSLARLQQAIVVALFAAAASWIAWRWPHSPMSAIAGAVAIVFGYSIFLALEFFLLKTVGNDPHVPPLRWRDAFRAWWGETVTTPRVFFWRQPFRWNAEPDQLTATPGKRGIVFVHGFVCNRGFWNPWMRKLRASGHPFIAVNLEPVFGSIESYVAIVDGAVARVTQSAGGLPPMVVCHSMGGLAARAWLRAKGGAVRVHHVVTIGTPHRGTWLGRFSHTRNGREMRLEGKWVTQLAQESARVPFTCWYSNCDNIVFPASTATLPGADNRLVRGIAHVELAFVPEVFAHAAQLLAAS